MKSKIITYFLLFTLPVYFGCSSLMPISRNEWNQINCGDDQKKEIQILTIRGYSYNLYCGSVKIVNDSLCGTGYRKSNYGTVPYEGSIALKDISEIRTDQFDWEVTLILIGVIGLFGFFLLLMGAQGMRSAASNIKFI